MKKLFAFVFASAMALTMVGAPITAQAAICQVTVGDRVTNYNGQCGDISDILSRLGLNDNACTEGTDCVKGVVCVEGTDCVKGASCSEGTNCVTLIDCLNGQFNFEQFNLIKNCK